METLEADTSYEFGEYKTSVSAGIHISDHPLLIRIQYKACKQDCLPTLLLYDSSDARYYMENDPLAERRDFVEYGTIGLDGKVVPDRVRNMQHHSSERKAETSVTDEWHQADIQLVKQDDHLLIKMITAEREEDVTFALRDASRYAYLAFTGTHCTVNILDVQEALQAVEKDYIPRIAERVTYIDRPEGDIPN